MTVREGRRRWRGVGGGLTGLVTDFPPHKWRENMKAKLCWERELVCVVHKWLTWLIYGRDIIIIVGSIDCSDGGYKIYCQEFPHSLSLHHAGGQLYFVVIIVVDVAIFELYKITQWKHVFNFENVPLTMTLLILLFKPNIIFWVQEYCYCPLWIGPQT